MSHGGHEARAAERGRGAGARHSHPAKLQALCPPEEPVSPAGWVVTPLLATALLPRHSPADVLEGALWLAGRGAPWEVHLHSPKCPSAGGRIVLGGGCAEHHGLWGRCPLDAGHITPPPTLSQL